MLGDLNKRQEHASFKLCGGGARQKALDLRFRSLQVDQSRGAQEVADRLKLTGGAPQHNSC